MQNIEFKPRTPVFVKETQTSIVVDYIDFLGRKRKGEIICNEYIAEDLINIFKELLKMEFPIYSIFPVSNFNWDDQISVKANNSSCFNFRTVLGTDKLSEHSFGSAIDINPIQNPWINPVKYKNNMFMYYFDKISKRRYNVSDLGTINKDVVAVFSKYGFEWGGNWNKPDYQHFYKMDKYMENYKNKVNKYFKYI